MTLCIEDPLNVNLPNDPIRHLGTVGDIVTFLSEQIGEIAGSAAVFFHPAA